MVPPSDSSDLTQVQVVRTGVMGTTRNLSHPCSCIGIDAHCRKFGTYGKVLYYSEDTRGSDDGTLTTAKRVCLLYGLFTKVWLGLREPNKEWWSTQDQQQEGTMTTCKPQGASGGIVQQILESYRYNRELPTELVEGHRPSQPLLTKSGFLE